MLHARRLLVALLLLEILPLTLLAETRVKSEPLAFEFTYADAELAKDGKIPFFRVFPEGKDSKGNDASGTLETLKTARGKSKLYGDEDAKPGLIVLLRRVVFVPLPDGDFQAILEGEFNAVRTTIKQATMAKLLAGEATELVFESKATKGIRPVGFTIEAKTTMQAQLLDGQLRIFGGEGASTITHYALLGNYIYESDPVPLAPAGNKAPVFVGRYAKPKLKNGLPETLPVIN